ncbi:hypothetical protein [Nitratifractor sp.]
MKHKKICFSLLLGSSVLWAGPNGPVDTGDMALQATGEIHITGTQTVAEEGKCSYNEYVITGTITGTDDDTGKGEDLVQFVLWDDGVLKDEANVTVDVGETIPINVVLSFKGLYGTGAPGVGVGAPEIEGGYIDPFYPKDVNGSCPRNGITKCWVTPHITRAGGRVTFNAEIIGKAKIVALYNGNNPVKIGKRLVKLTDPDGDNIYSVTYRIPKSTLPTGPWLFDYKVRAVGNWKGDDWCPGIRVRH